MRVSGKPTRRGGGLVRAAAASPLQLQAKLGRRSSGAAGKHDSRPRRLRTRAAMRAAAVQDADG